MPKYPDVKVKVNLKGPDGNVFALIGIVGAAIESEGHDSMPFFEEVEGMMMSGTYNDVLAFIQKTVNATFVR